MGLTPGNARHHHTSKRLSRPIQLECLACGTTRVAYGYGTEETGQCPQCSYVGWTYAPELDGWETRRIMNGDTEPLTTTQRSLRPAGVLARAH